MKTGVMLLRRRMQEPAVMVISLMQVDTDVRPISVMAELARVVRDLIMAMSVRNGVTVTVRSVRVLIRILMTTIVSVLRIVHVSARIWVKVASVAIARALTHVSKRVANAHSVHALIRMGLKEESVFSVPMEANASIVADNVLVLMVRKAEVNVRSVLALMQRGGASVLSVPASTMPVAETDIIVRSVVRQTMTRMPNIARRNR